VGFCRRCLSGFGGKPGRLGGFQNCPVWHQWQDKRQVFALVAGAVLEVRAGAILDVVIDQVELPALAFDQDKWGGWNPRDDFNGWFYNGCLYFFHGVLLCYTPSLIKTMRLTNYTVFIGYSPFFRKVFLLIFGANSAFISGASLLLRR
jgi:hypothetical protein